MILFATLVTTANLVVCLLCLWRLAGWRGDVANLHEAIKGSVSGLDNRLTYRIAAEANSIRESLPRKRVRRPKATVIVDRDMA